jgi:hypothetical protein
MLKPFTTAIGFAIFFALVHAMWAGVVAFGWAQPFMDFIFRLHFITPPYTIETFEMSRAVLLVAVTGAIGFVAGLFFALIWNTVHGNRNG